MLEMSRGYCTLYLLGKSRVDNVNCVCVVAGEGECVIGLGPVVQN